MDDRVKDLKLALKAKLEAIPQGIVLVRSNHWKRIAHEFMDTAEDLEILGKHYSFIGAPSNWDGTFTKTNTELLRQILIEFEREDARENKNN